MANIDWKHAFDASNLDQQNPGKWPIGIQGITFIAATAAVIAVGWFVDLGPYVAVQNQQKQLATVQQKEPELKTTFESKARQAASLEALKAQLKEMKRSFGAALKKLPKKAEVDELLVDISQTGVRSGLEFNLFKPLGDQPKEFYAEVPISISVIGTFHEFGDFVSGLSELSRIVTVHDVKLVRGGGKSKKAGQRPSNKLTMTLTAKTYRYVDEEEGEGGK
ncbi:MAG: type 4a pilus biogenesis protein PilO [Gammaproteobacteria bacterium]|nr:MAG: type 4a pilus biogenesis protein PilO [Gammaproteobacteria bacterium]